MEVTPSSLTPLVVIAVEEIAQWVPKVRRRKLRVPMESVDYWPMATLFIRHLGVSPGS